MNFSCLWFSILRPTIYSIPYKFLEFVSSIRWQFRWIVMSSTHGSLIIPSIIFNFSISSGVIFICSPLVLCSPMSAIKSLNSFLRNHRIPSILHHENFISTPIPKAPPLALTNNNANYRNCKFHHL